MRANYIRLLERRGCDPRIGRRLRRLCLELGMPEPHVTLLAPLYLEGEGKLLAPSTLELTAEAIAKEGLAGEEEIAAALASLHRLVQDPRSLVTGPKIYQVSNRKS